MESIQYAYQGFAKQNYTMLDNLRLGYGGTKTEMERLLKDAQKLTGVKYDIKNLNDVFQAIHVIQQELGITGTTAKEAEETISGSIASLKGAWDNFLNGSGKFNQVVEAAKIAFKNIYNAVKEQIPRIAKEILEAIPDEFLKKIKILGGLIASLTAGMIAYKAVLIATTAIQFFSSMASSIVTVFSLIKYVRSLKDVMLLLNMAMNANPIGIIIGLVAALVAAFIYFWNTSEGFRNFWINLWETIKSAISTAVKVIVEWFNKIIDFVKNNWQGLLLLLVNPIWGAFKLLYDNCEGFRNFINNFLKNIKQFFINAWNSIVSFFTEGIPNFIQSVIQWIQDLPYKIGYFLGQILGHIIQFGQNAWNWVTIELPKIIEAIIQWFKELPGRIWEWLVQTVNNISTWGKNIKDTAVNKVSEMINAAVDWFKSLPGKIWTWLLNTIDKIKQFTKDMANKGKEGAKNLFNNIVNTIKNLPSQMLNIGKNIVQGLWNGIVNAKNWIVNKVKSFANGILDGMKSALGIHSPSRVFRDEVGKFIPQGIAVGIEADTDSALKAIDSMNDDIMSEMNKAVAFETGAINANASVKANNSTLNIIQSRIESINNDKEITINTTTNLDSKVIANTVNKVNTRQKLQYGIA